MTIQERLFELTDEKYAKFCANLTPTIDESFFIGIKIPVLRSLTKKLTKEEKEQFIQELPHHYYEENILHGCIISEIKDYEKSIQMLEQFLPYIDNWAVCDTIKPKPYPKHLDELLLYIQQWIKSDHIYTIRFAIGQLMGLYLDDAFKEEYLEMVANVKHDDYYVKMMVAWYFATALAKQWDATIIYIQQNRLPVWIHNKTIQKARESRRISDEQKEYLNSLKVKK